MGAATDGLYGFTELAGASGVATFVIGSSTYVIVASLSDDGVQLIDVSNPAVPVAVGAATDGVNGFSTLDGARNVATFVIGSSTYAIVAAYYDDGVQLIDVSDPSSPVALGSATDGQNGFTELDGAFDVSTFVIGNTLYAIVASYYDDGVQLIDVSNPSSGPVAMGSATDGSGGMQLGGARAVDVFGIGGSTYAVVAASADDALQLMNISDPALPVAIWIGVDGQQNMTRLGAVSDVATFAVGSALFAIAAAHDDNGVQLLSVAECDTSVMHAGNVTADNASNTS
jgi:hypothetical protein